MLDSKPRKKKNKPQKKEYEIDSKTKVLIELWTLVCKEEIYIAIWELS